jgi:uncharacterized protein YgiM (DUF1202 family)
MVNWNRLPILVFIIFCLAVSGCARFSAGDTPSPDTLALSQTPTFPATAATLPATTTLAPTVTLEPIETPLPPTITPTHVPAGNVHASTNVLSLNLRSGPGTSFGVRSKAEKGAQFEVQGKAPGNGWALVKKANGQTGWVALSFLTLEGALEDIPTAPVDFALVIQGRVIDSAGSPVEGIIMAVSKSAALAANPRTEAATDANGQFFAYLPKDSGGTWYLGQSGIACTSRVASANCTLVGSVTPKPFTLRLTGTTPAQITFNYLPQ